MPTHNPQPTISSVKLGGSADVRALPDQPVSGTGEASQAGLFPAETSLPIASGGVPPSRLDFNAVLAQLGATQYYVQHGGVFGYSAAVSYDAAALVSYSGSLYMALQANGSDEAAGVVTPGDDPDVWMELGSGAGPWATDRNIRIGDYAGANYGVTAALNQGTGTFTLDMPQQAKIKKIYDLTVQSENQTVGYTLGGSGATWYLEIAQENTASGLTQRTYISRYGATHSYTGVATNYTPWHWSRQYANDSGQAFLAKASVAWSDSGSGTSGFYIDRLTMQPGLIALEQVTTDGDYPGSGTGAFPPGWADASVASQNGDGTAITLTQVRHTAPKINSSGVAFGGYNTVGSTIMAARHTTTGDTANNYGTLVAGSDLCWAGWDTDGGGVNQSAAGDLHLSGTWVKCSGQATTHGGTNGMGLYRRIL